MLWLHLLSAAMRLIPSPRMCTTPEPRQLFDVLCEGAAVARNQPSERTPSPDLLGLLREAAALEHAQECDAGHLNWAVDALTRERLRPPRFSDADFVTTRLEGPAGLAGPDASVLCDASCIHQTRERVLSDDEINALTAEAGAAIAAGTSASARRSNL